MLLENSEVVLQEVLCSGGLGGLDAKPELGTEPHSGEGFGGEEHFVWEGQLDEKEQFDVEEGDEMGDLGEDQIDEKEELGEEEYLDEGTFGVEDHEVVQLGEEDHFGHMIADIGAVSVAGCRAS